MPTPVSLIPPARLTAEQLHRYRELRLLGVAAVNAFPSATAAPVAHRYRSGPGDAITLLLDDHPDLAGFTVTARAEPDYDPRPSVAGGVHRHAVASRHREQP